MHDFAIYNDTIFLLLKKPVEDSNLFQYNLVVLVKKAARSNPKTLKKSSTMIADPEQDKYDAVIYQEYVKSREFFYDFSSMGLIPEGDLPF